MKRLIALLLTLVLLVGILPLNSLAASVSIKEPELPGSGRLVHINPMYADSFSAADLDTPSFSAPEYAAVTYYDSSKKVSQVIRSAMEARETSVLVGYKIPIATYESDDLNDVFYASLDYAFAHTGVPTQGDYIYHHYKGCSVDYEYTGYSSDSVYYFFTMAYSFKYSTSAAQEATVTNQVNALLSQLNPSGTNYQKIKTVYDWMCANITYDYANLENDAYKLKYSAYAALINRTAVCQGYSLLLYRLALEMGIDNRMVLSIDEENHVWNIISMGNLYYNCDATWDAGEPSNGYDWFLLSDADFTQHTRCADHNTSSFRSSYPMGKYSYDPNTAATITTQPKSVAVAKGETAKVTVKATGNGLTYKWYFKDADASKYSLTTSFTGNTYSVKMSAERAGRKVYCKITDQYGNTVKTNTVTLSMATPLKITTQPKNVTVMKGETAKVTLKATGDGLTYKWYYKNAGDTKYTYTSSFKSNSYSVEMTSARNGRRVLCKVYDKYGNMVQSESVVLKMAKPVYIKTQPVSVTVKKGATAKVSFTAVGDGLTYKWYYKDAGASKYTYTDSFKSNTYSVKMTAARNGRRILCKVYDKYGNMVQTNSVTIKMK